MNPLQTVFRQIAVIAVAAFFSFLVRKGILSVEAAETMTPAMHSVVDSYLPLAITGITAIAHQIYLKYIGSRLFDVARQLPAGVTEKAVNDQALGEGGRRTVAKILGGVE